ARRGLAFHLVGNAARRRSDRRWGMAAVSAVNSRADRLGSDHQLLRRHRLFVPGHVAQCGNAYLSGARNVSHRLSSSRTERPALGGLLRRRTSRQSRNRSGSDRAATTVCRSRHGGSCLCHPGADGRPRELSVRLLPILTEHKMEDSIAQTQATKPREPLNVELTANGTDRHQWHKWLVIFLSLSLAGSGMLYLAVVLIDPFSTGRFSLTQRIDIATKNKRLYSAGLVRDLRFNAALFGDSTSFALDPRTIAGA